MEHLFSCFNTMYNVLGAGAPTLSDDAYVIRTYETARAVGEVTMAFREYLGDAQPEDVPAMRAVLDDALASDLSGAMVLYCFVMVVAPRVLVSLRDAREEVELDGDALKLVNMASDVLIRETFAVGEVAKSEGTSEDPHWQERARRLSETLEAAGNAESFGLSR